MNAFSITEAFVSHISSLGYEVSSRVPKKRPELFVTVERTGGGVNSFVDHPVMAVQVWAKTDACAEEAANALRNTLLTQPPPSGVHSIKLESGPYPFFDEETGCARYQMVLRTPCKL